MIVNRRTFTVHSGRVDAFVELVESGADHIPDRPNVRVYRSMTGLLGRVALELDFEDLAHYERFWAAWRDAPGTAQVREELATHGYHPETNELWHMR